MGTRNTRFVDTNADIDMLHNTLYASTRAYFEDSTRSTSTKILCAKREIDIMVHLRKE